MLGIQLGVAQQGINQQLTLARIFVADESLELSRSGWKPPEIEVDASRKDRVSDHARESYLVLCKIRSDKPINRVRDAALRQVRLPGSDRGDPTGSRAGRGLRPNGAF